MRRNARGKNNGLEIRSRGLRFLFGAFCLAFSVLREGRKMPYIKHARKNQLPQQKRLGVWSGHESHWENNFDAVVVHVWEAWTKNGLGLDHDDHVETLKTVQDAVTNEWVEDISQENWRCAALARLKQPE